LVVADIVRQAGEYELAGFLDDRNPQRAGEAFGGSTILGGLEQLPELVSRGVTHFMFGFGDSVRLQLTEKAKSFGLQLATAIHPRAIIAPDVTLGAGTMVAAGVIINPAAAIGENVIVNTGATIDHECIIEDGAHICPGVNLAGNVRVGRAAWVGIGSSVIQRITIGAGAFIGAGSVVVRDIPANAVAYGCPAKVVRFR
jgi:acetyltransferase EpsM